MYFVVEATKALDGTVANTVYNFSTVEEAKQSFHYFLSVSINKTDLDYCMASIINNVGVVVSNESWFRPIPEQTPEPSAE